eukprot:6183369-Pleurochrysis_carterae.AAC.2
MGALHVMQIQCISTDFTYRTLLQMLLRGQRTCCTDSANNTVQGSNDIACSPPPALASAVRASPGKTAMKENSNDQHGRRRIPNNNFK